MTSAEVLSEAFGRLPELVRGAVEGLDADQLSLRPGGSANSIAWLVWHLARVEDSHFADAFKVARACRTVPVSSASTRSSVPSGDRPRRARACASAASACCTRS